MKVTIWHGTGPEVFVRGYRPGDPIRQVYEYDWEGDGLGVTPETVAEQAFAMFNGDPMSDWERGQSDRYYAAGNRSLSVGDVVVIGEIALACEPAGWQPVAIPADDA